MLQSSSPCRYKDGSLVADNHPLSVPCFFAGCPMLNALPKYISLFGNLHRNFVAKKGYAPHKPILLLAVLDEIERGNIELNLIQITPELVASFRAYWRTLVPPGTWVERLVYPFRYLVRDGFWELVLNGVPQSVQTLGDPTSLHELAGLIDGAQLASD